MSLDASYFKKVPLAEITSAEQEAGFLRVIRDHWWAVTADDCVLICTCPHGVPHRWPCDQCDAAFLPGTSNDQQKGGA